MNFKQIVRDGIGSFSRRRLKDLEDTRFTFTEEREEEREAEGWNWAGMPTELLREVVARLEERCETWPARRNLVAFGSVCRSWRRICKEFVGVPEINGKLTFPDSVKQPGFRNATIQCYIKRNRSSSTYHLFLGLQPENGKFLLSARKIRLATHAEYIISMAGNDISKKSVSYVGKLRSNFLGTKFAIYDTQPPRSDGTIPAGCSSRRFHSRKVSPKVPTLSCGIAHISYELNMLGTRGPRRMQCVMYSIPATYAANSLTSPPSLESAVSQISLLDGKHGGCVASTTVGGSSRFMESWQFTAVPTGKEGPLVLRNKVPRWHEQLQCWCLNFRGRVTVASVKNFQLIAGHEPVRGAASATSSGDTADHDKIILQFGKIGKDLFTMDYRYPLSAFQAFAICLSSFDVKLACE